MKLKPLFLSLISVTLLLAGLYPLNLTFVSWFGFLPLFVLFVDSLCSRRTLFFCALTVGFLYYGVGLYWLFLFDARIYLLAFLFVAPVVGIYFLTLTLLNSKIKGDWLGVAAAPILWFGMQKLYALSPLSTIATDVPFYGPLPFFQLVSITNYAVFSAIILGVNFCIAGFLVRRKGAYLAGSLLFIGLASGIYLWGNQQLQKPVSRMNVKIAAVQHNFPVSGKWRLDHPMFIRSEYRRLALEASQRKPDLIVFPLYSFPDDALRSPEFFTGLAKETNTWLLVATYIPVKEGDSITRGFFDGALLYSPEGKLTDYYQAVQKPPFRDVPETTGDQYKILKTPFGNLGVLLCYEDSLPKIAKQAVERGADILIALSNPGHFVGTHMPYYHLMQDRFRAIESNRWLLRASANGFSALIDPRGRFIQKTELNQPQILYTDF